jgi:alpha-ketoglutarate-dependent taurine dioxygenase
VSRPLYTLRPITDHIGCLLEGASYDVLMSHACFERVHRAWIDTGLLVVRGLDMTPEQHIALSKRFGKLTAYTRSEFNAAEADAILVLSNIRKDGKLIGSPVSGRVWHTDGHYLHEPPSASILYALEVPPVGGDTWFANTASAYAELPERVKQRASGLRVVISRVQSRPYNYPDRPPPTPAEIKEWLDMPQPLVRTHPVTGRKSIYAGGNVPWRIEGLPFEEAAPLVTFLQEFCTQPRFTYCHQWNRGDLLVWDNRSVLHRATEYDQLRHRRLLHRTTTAGDAPF